MGGPPVWIRPDRHLLLRKPETGHRCRALAPPAPPAPHLSAALHWLGDHALSLQPSKLCANGARSTSDRSDRVLGREMVVSSSRQIGDVVNGRTRVVRFSVDVMLRVGYGENRPQLADTILGDGNIRLHFCRELSVRGSTTPIVPGRYGSGGGGYGASAAGRATGGVVSRAHQRGKRPGQAPEGVVVWKRDG